MKRFIIALLLFLVMLPLPETKAAEQLQDWGLSTEVSPTKEWTVTFKSEIDQSAFEHIQVVDEQQKVKPMKKVISAQKNAIILTPITPYEEGVLYTLTIDKKLKSAEGERLVAGGEKKFYVPSTKHSSITYKAGVEETYDFKYEATFEDHGVTVHQFKYNGTHSYKPNDFIVIQGQTQFPNGLAGQITGTIRYDDTNMSLKVKEVPLEKVVESMTLNSEVYLTAEQLQHVTVAGFNVRTYNVKDTALNIEKGEIKLTPKMKGKINGFDAQYDLVYALKDLKLNIDYDFSATLKVKEMRLSISGKQSVEKVAKFGFIDSSNGKALERPSLRNKTDIKDFEFKFAKIPVPISIPGVSGYVESGLIFEVALAGGAQFSSEESSDFEFGTLYKNKKFYEIIDNDSDSTVKSVMGFGELEAKFGIYGAVGVQALGKPLVEASLKGGAYTTFGVYAGITTGSRVCFANESGGFSSVGIQLMPDEDYGIGTDFEQKKALVKPVDCEETLRIEPTQTTINVEPGVKQKIKVKKEVVNLKNGNKSLETIKAKKINYLYDSKFIVLNAKTGEVTLTKDAPERVAVEITYVEDAKTFNTSVTLVKAFDEEAINKEVTKKKAELKAKYLNVFETKMLDSGRQLLVVHYPKDGFKTFIYVYNYNEQTKKWSKVYDQTFSSLFQYKQPAISINNNSLEQHIIFDELGSWLGSWTVFTVVGSKDGKTVETLYLEQSPKKIGTLYVDDNSFYICDNDESSKYSWNGSKFTQKSNSCSSSSISTEDKILLKTYYN